MFIDLLTICEAVSTSLWVRICDWMRVHHGEVGQPDPKSQGTNGYESTETSKVINSWDGEFMGRFGNPQWHRPKGDSVMSGSLGAPIKSQARGQPPEPLPQQAVACRAYGAGTEVLENFIERPSLFFRKSGMQSENLAFDLQMTYTCFPCFTVPGLLEISILFLIDRALAFPQFRHMYEFDARFALNKAFAPS